MKKITFDDFPDGICFWTKTVQPVLEDEAKKQFWVGRIDEPGAFEFRSAFVTSRWGVDAENWDDALQIIWANRAKLGIE